MAAGLRAVRGGRGFPRKPLLSAVVAPLVAGVGIAGQCGLGQGAAQLAFAQQPDQRCVVRNDVGFHPHLFQLGGLGLCGGFVQSAPDQQRRALEHALAEVGAFHAESRRHACLHAGGILAIQQAAGEHEAVNGHAIPPGAASCADATRVGVAPGTQADFGSQPGYA